MSRTLPHLEHRRQRTRVALLGALLFHAALGLLPLPRFSGSWGLRGGSGDGSARGARFAAAALQGTEVTLQKPPAAPPEANVPTAPPPEPEPEPPEPELDPVEPEVQVTEALDPVPDSPPTPAETPAVAGAAAGGAPGAAHAGEAAGDGTEGAGDPGGGLVPTGPIEVDLVPKVSAWPAVPEKVLRKRKIMDYVLLQLLVGTDGLVREVRVLRAIPNCDECVQSAIDAARRQRYDAVMVDGRLVEFLTTAQYEFKYRQ